MTIRFRPLFSIVMIHEAFPEGPWRGPRLTPTAGCARLMARHRCRFRPEPAGGTMYYGAEGDRIPIAGFAGPGAFDFALTLTDPDFERYTDLAGQTSTNEVVFQFDNLWEAAPDGPPFRLPRPEALPSRSRRFAVQLDEPVEGGLLTAAIDGVPWSRRELPPGRRTHVGVELDEAPAGVCSVALDGSELARFLLLDGGSPPWGILRIFPSGPGPAVPPGAAILPVIPVRDPWPSFVLEFKKPAKDQHYKGS